jgi:hypothetical protein
MAVRQSGNARSTTKSLKTELSRMHEELVHDHVDFHYTHLSFLSLEQLRAMLSVGCT